MKNKKNKFFEDLKEALLEILAYKQGKIKLYSETFEIKPKNKKKKRIKNSSNSPA
jgi:hypothetical protein